MTSVNASELARALDISAGRVSQLVSERKLDGCWTGEGRARRFDLAKCAEALGRRLDPGQMMGNGSGTADALRRIADRAPTVESEAEDEGSRIPRADQDGDRYQRARADMAETNAAQARLKLAQELGRYVLASEVELQVRRAVAGEIAEFETVMRTGAQKVAAEFGLDAPTVRSILTAEWRAHRARRAERAAEAAEAAEFSEAEAIEQDQGAVV